MSIALPSFHGFLKPASVGGGGGCGLLPGVPTSNLQFDHVGECLSGNDGDSVSSWVDSFGANDFVSTNGLPLKKTNIINSLSVLRCNGDDRATLNTGVAVSVFSYIFLISPSNLSGQHTLVSGPTGALQVRLNASKINVLKAATADMGSSSTSLSTGVFITGGVTYDGSTLKFYLNGVADGSVSVSQTFTANLTSALVNPANNVENFHGDLAEHLFWTSVLNESTHMLNGGGGVTDALRAKYAHY